MKNMIITTAALLLFSIPTDGIAQSKGGCVQVVIGSEQKNRGQFDTTFSATGVLDIDFSVIFTPGTVNRFAQDHLVEFRVYTPSGALYQSVPVAFSNDSRKQGREVRIGGLPYPVKTKAMKAVAVKNQPHQAVQGRIAVAGTPIINNSLYGEWKVEAVIDGESLPCASPASFTITQ